MGIFRNQHKRKIIITGVAALVIIVCGLTAYFGDYYRADDEAIREFITQDISVRKETYGTIVFKPDRASKGFIFYPGGKVEHTAYIPLMQVCAEQGILCVLVEMPFNLAVFDIKAADGIQEKYPEIEDWYIGGHSLGGAMAAYYLEKNIENYEGLILCGAYSTADLSESNLDVLSIFGSEDQVMNKEKYDENKSNLPKDFTQIIIDGGCHAYFGMYGVQEGDGRPAISNEDQIYITAEYIVKIME